MLPRLDASIHALFLFRGDAVSFDLFHDVERLLILIELLCEIVSVCLGVPVVVCIIRLVFGDFTCQ